PAPGSGPFVGENRLTPGQIDLLQRWADGGAQAGTAPLPPAPNISAGWQLGTPDLVVSLPRYRSEEHTSELQSLTNLVCRLLLSCDCPHPDLHSFPTRRSSDLTGARIGSVRRRKSPDAGTNRSPAAVGRRRSAGGHRSVAAGAEHLCRMAAWNA